MESSEAKQKRIGVRWFVIVLVLLCVVAGGVAALVIFLNNRVEISTYEEAVEYVWGYVENEDTE